MTIEHQCPGCVKLKAEKSGPYFQHYQSALGKIAVLESQAAYRKQLHEAEVADLTAERDAARDALRWCLRQMPEPSSRATDTGDYTGGYRRALAVLENRT